MRQLFRELKRRNVYRVAVAYAAAAFVVVQAARLLVPALLLPDWIYRAVVLAAILGFPIALVIAWAFEVTPEGVQRTSAEAGEAGGASRSPEELRVRSRLAMKAVVGLGVVAAAAAGGWYLMGGGGTKEPEARLGDRSLAVLPFEALGQQEPDALTEGMHDDLLARLSNVSELKVISRTSVQQYRDTRKTAAEIARELGVRWVLEGGVQQMGAQIQVNAQLIDPRTDTHAWAETYRRDLTAANLFDLQSEITKKIARSLEARLTADETERVERRPTENLEAYRLYVRGRKLLAQRTVGSIRKATGYFQRALQQDSSYALAWAGLADAQVLTAIYDDELSEDRRKALTNEAMVSAREARKIDPELAEAWAALGAIHIYEQRAGWKEGRGPVALQELHRAVALKPSYAHAQQWLAELYLRLGRPDRGLEHASLAVELDPEHAAAREMLIRALVANDRGGEVWSHFQKYSGSSVTFLKFFTLYHTGRWDDLGALARKQLEEEGGVLSRFSLARIAASQGDTAAAREQLAWFRKAESYFGEGLVHAALGETDEAFSAWAKLEEWRWSRPEALRYWFSDILAPLRDDPRYRQLIRDFNRQWGLNPDGSLPDSVDVSFESDD